MTAQAGLADERTSTALLSCLKRAAEGVTRHGGWVTPERLAGVAWEDFGLEEYDAVHTRMLAQVEAVRAGEAPETVWVGQHPPVFTVGRNAQRGEALPDTVQVDDALVSVVPVARGGGWTWHGPGQWVVYPLLRVGTYELHAVRDWTLAVLRQVCADQFGLSSLTVQGETPGLWTPDGRKVASVGVAVRRGVSFHGVALNVTCSLSGFQAITPCGLRPEVMTRIADLVPNRDLLP